MRSTASRRGRWAWLVVMTAVLAAALLVPSAAGAQDEQGERALGRVFSGTGQDQERHAGVTITVTDAEGAEVGSAETDDNGEVLIDLPGPGEYTIALDPATLPEGLLPRDDVTERTQTVQAGRQANALFPLVEGDGTGQPVAGAGDRGRSFTDQLGSVPQLTLDGIKLGSIIAITAIGLSLIFGTTGLINFAHGELVTLGAVVAFFFNASAGGPRWHLLLAVVPAVLVGALGGATLETAVWRPLRRRGVGLISMLVISIGLMFVIRNVILIVYGGGTRPFADYNIQSAIRFAGVAIPPRDLAIIVISLVVLVGVGLMLNRTRIGKALRAVADNRDLAESSGIDVERVIRFVWLLGGGLAAFGGVLLGSTEQVNQNMGFNLLLLMFAGIILGGIGTAYGAMVGSLIVGIVSQVSTAFFSVQLKFVWALLILIIVLLIRPQGLLGRRERFG
ncbi:branched-chain amino acid ABC transporter permease [Euzebya sp.]|uniref:ABC transporter permease subunit n=1 Tax=Euzebya sp. TaxID=1971409 RepID=UPI00351154C2